MERRACEAAGSHLEARRALLPPSDAHADRASPAASNEIHSTQSTLSVHSTVDYETSTRTGSAAKQFGCSSEINLHLCTSVLGDGD